MFEVKYTDVLERLRFDIRNGRFGGTNFRLPSFRELAREYNVSLVTMSKSMNCLHQENIIDICGTRGAFIRENIEARSKSNDIAVIHEFIGDPSGAFAIEMIEKQAREHRMGTLALKAAGGSQYLPKLYTNLNADGFIFIHSTLTLDAAEALHNAKIPFVSLNRLDSQIVSWVDFDNEGGTAEALDFLLGIGCRRIADVNFKIEFGDYQERICQVYREKLIAAGCYDEKLFIARDSRNEFRGKYSLDFAEKAGRNMAEYLLELPELPDAVIVREVSYRAMLDECGKNGVDLRKKAHIMLVMEDVQERPDGFSVLLSPFEEKTRAGFDMLYQMVRNHDFKVRHKLISQKKHFIKR